MLFSLFACLVVLLRADCSAETSLKTYNVDKHFIYNKYKYDVINTIIVNETTEQILDFYEEDERWHGYPTRVHVSSNDSLDGDNPVFITATQQKGVSSWELPEAEGPGVVYREMARTLCPHDAGPNVTSVNRPTLQLSTSHRANVTVDIKLRRVTDFYVELNKEVEVGIAASTPKYYYFSFDSTPWNNSQGDHVSRFNYTIPKSVMLIIDSDDDVCAVVSIQNNSCPVFDTEREVLYRGYRLTVTTKGGITLTQSMFPVGFYIVFIVKESDAECSGVYGPSLPRNKTFRFTVVPVVSLSSYVTAALVSLSLVAAVAALAGLLTYISCTCTETVVIEEENPGPSTSRTEEGTTEATPIIDESSDSDGAGGEEGGACAVPAELTVAELNRSRPAARNKRSDRYFWSALTVAVVYALPVVQLLVTYQHMVFQTGDQDLCYYNFLCAHPLGPLADSNHVFTNIGYVILGVVFMGQVRVRQIRARKEPPALGIPQHWGVLYTLGLALVMEGALSACYHLCPNKMNFQFDSSFMYVTAALVMVKLYQSRHCDVNARAHSTFLLLAAIMAIGCYGILYPGLYFWALFTILHLATCFILTLKIYYVGKWKLESRILSSAYRHIQSHGRYSLRPRFTARASLLAIANLANWALAAHGIYAHNSDFARHLLALLMGNALLYTLFYVAMKLLHRECLPAYVWCQLVLAHIAWVTAFWFFLDARTKWSETPAQSRQHNAVCSALQLFDSHDLWHGASAAALFLSFNLLLSVDDGLSRTPRHRIPVF